MKAKVKLQIVVADRGFVYIGKVQMTSAFCTVTDAKNIRIWGTTAGLGELVSGPTAKTVLDKVGTVHIPQRAIISLIDCEEAGWKAAF